MNHGAPPAYEPRRDLRARIRPLVSRPAWVLAHRALNLRAALRQLPLLDVLGLHGLRRPRGGLHVMRPRNLRHPFLLPDDRAARRSFVDVVLRELYAAYAPRISAPVILDGGAHVGDSGAWFLSRYPDSRVISVEPASASHAVLLRNLAPYGERALAVNAALWGEPGTLTLVDPGASTGVSATPKPMEKGEKVPAVTPGDLMEELGIAHLDLLKLDVEGAETSLFTSPSLRDWIGRVTAIMVELHGPEAEAAVVGALQRHGFSVRRHRELHVAVH